MDHCPWGLGRGLDRVDFPPNILDRHLVAGYEAVIADADHPAVVVAAAAEIVDAGLPSAAALPAALALIAFDVVALAPGAIAADVLVLTASAVADVLYVSLLQVAFAGYALVLKVAVSLAPSHAARIDAPLRFVPASAVEFAFGVALLIVHCVDFGG